MQVVAVRTHEGSRFVITLERDKKDVVSAVACRNVKQDEMPISVNRKRSDRDTTRCYARLGLG
jgi:hypothetical protein